MNKDKYINCGTSKAISSKTVGKQKLVSYVATLSVSDKEKAKEYAEALLAGKGITLFANELVSKFPNEHSKKYLGFTFADVKDLK